MPPSHVLWCRQHWTKITPNSDNAFILHREVMIRRRAEPMMQYMNWLLRVGSLFAFFALLVSRDAFLIFTLLTHLYPQRVTLFYERISLRNHMSINSVNQMKIWSSHLLDNLSNCLMNLKNSGDSTGFEHSFIWHSFIWHSFIWHSFIWHSFHGKTWARQIDLLFTVWLHSSVG